MTLRNRCGVHVGVLGCLITCGCSIDYVDGDGVRHIRGLVSLSIAPAPANTPLAGEVVTVKSAGMALYADNDGVALMLGIQSRASAHLRDDALVSGNPLDPSSFCPIQKEPLNVDPYLSCSCNPSPRRLYGEPQSRDLCHRYQRRD